MSWTGTTTTRKHPTPCFPPTDGSTRGILGVLDPDGYLYIKGRSKSLILGPSGQNIYPEEIEDLLNAQPYIAESLVIDGKVNSWPLSIQMPRP